MDDTRLLKVTLLTGRTIEQGVSKEIGKASREYLESVAICYMDADDLKTLGIKEGTNIQLSTSFGSVVLKALKSPWNQRHGVVFVPYGPWANAIVDPETNSVGMPSLKGISVEVQAVPSQPVLDLADLLRKQFGKDCYVGR